MRDFRYLRVTESSTDWLASCSLLADGVYMKYMKITKERREKNEIPKRKLHVFLFFSTDQNLLRDITAKITLILRLHFAYSSYESLLKKKVLIYKAISGTDNAYCGSKL